MKSSSKRDGVKYRRYLILLNLHCSKIIIKWKIFIWCLYITIIISQKYDNIILCSRFVCVRVRVVYVQTMFYCNNYKNIIYWNVKLLINKLPLFTRNLDFTVRYIIIKLYTTIATLENRSEIPKILCSSCVTVFARNRLRKI